MQSTENAVAPTNVDPFLREGASFIYGAISILGLNELRAHEQLRDVLNKGPANKGAYVMWLNAGHEVRQERKEAILDLLDRLAAPDATIPRDSVDEASLRPSVKVPTRANAAGGKKRKKKRKRRGEVGHSFTTAGAEGANVLNGEEDEEKEEKEERLDQHLDGSSSPMVQRLKATWQQQCQQVIEAQMH